MASPDFSSVLLSSKARKTGLGNTTIPVADAPDPAPEIALEPAPAADPLPSPPEPAAPVETASESTPATVASGEGKPKSEKSNWKPFSTRANPRLIKAVNKQLLEEDRNFTDLFDELLTKWLRERGIELPKELQ